MAKTDESYITQQERDVPGDGDDVQVQAPDGQAEGTAEALLAAADKLGLDAAVVRTADGHFLVPAKVADTAKLPEGGEVEPVPAGLTTPSEQRTVAPEFATKGEAEAFAKAHGLQVPDDTSAKYRAAVTKAFAARGTG